METLLYGTGLIVSMLIVYWGWNRQGAAEITFLIGFAPLISFAVAEVVMSLFGCTAHEFDMRRCWVGPIDLSMLLFPMRIAVMLLQFTWPLALASIVLYIAMALRWVR
jgi:hypothetical protein